MPPAGVETTILIARVGHASAQAVSEAAIVRHAIAAAQILADVRTSASPFSLCHWAAGSHRNEVSHGQGGGSRNQNIVSLCEMIIADLQENPARQAWRRAPPQVRKRLSSSEVRSAARRPPDRPPPEASSRSCCRTADSAKRRVRQSPTLRRRRRGGCRSHP